MRQKRCSGILLHPTSLPGPFGIGSFGAEAYRFVDWLASAEQSIWQILPLGPTGYGDSPYSAFSAFAGNPLLICLERLVECGDLDPDDIAAVAMPEGVVSYGFVHGFKGRLLRKAAARFRNGEDAGRRADFDRFCEDQGAWLDDFALFMAVREHLGGKPWHRWPEAIRARRAEALHSWGSELSEAVFAHKFAQFLFFGQWLALKEYANTHGVRILGDIPIFVAPDSADVWANPELFHLDDNQLPTLVAGVPPDYFSATGQLWGNPLYNWERMKENGYAWWRSRFRWNLQIADLVRIDHFRGFAACWAVAAGESTAVNGSWMPVPGGELFQALEDEIGKAPILAEDLGIITPDVDELRHRFGFPGMKVLHFAFGGGSDNPYLPHNAEQECVFYTGTHDNDTTLGWWKALGEQERGAVVRYMGRLSDEMPWGLIRLALQSVATTCIMPLQDILSLGTKARMNRPGTAQGNWTWRLLPGTPGEAEARRLGELTRVYGRGLESV